MFIPANFPEPTPEAAEQSKQLSDRIHDEIRQTGKITFARFMELALYAPGLGYYSGGAQKFGQEGDFITAPELSPLFALCLAQQSGQVLQTLEQKEILEFGAGSGKLAAELMLSLEALECLPDHYSILELSAELQQRQHAYIKKRCPHLLSRFSWLKQLPNPGFQGVMVANEVMDAMPVHRILLDEKGDKEYFITSEDGSLQWTLAEISTPALGERMVEIRQNTGATFHTYTSEINLIAERWVASMAEILAKGALFIIDYGFTEREYYHPQRNQGTVMCHYRHRAHSDPLTLIGLQDITAHVDFTRLADVALSHGLEVAGYNDQASFLMGCGLLQFMQDLLEKSEESPWLSVLEDKDTSHLQYKLAQQVKSLTLPSEMGELFKVIAFTKNIEEPLLGFSLSNRKEFL